MHFKQIAFQSELHVCKLYNSSLFKLMLYLQVRVSHDFGWKQIWFRTRENGKLLRAVSNHIIYPEAQNSTGSSIL